MNGLVAPAPAQVPKPTPSPVSQQLHQREGSLPVSHQNTPEPARSSNIRITDTGTIRTAGGSVVKNIVAPVILKVNSNRLCLFPKGTWLRNYAI